MIRFLFSCFLLLFYFAKGSGINPADFGLDPINIHLDSLQNIDCQHQSGYIAVSATGGSPGYNYFWSDGATGPIRAGLGAGTYEVEVKDQNGNASSQSIIILEDLALPNADAGNPALVTCSNAVVTLAGSGSAGPEFSYLWTASGGGHIQSGAQTLNPVVDQAGTFTLTVTNADNGCSATDEVKVTATHQAPTAIATGGVLTCASPTLQLQVTYTKINTRFSWQGPMGFQSGLEKPQVSSAGSYIFTVTDTLTGCLAKSTALVTSNFTQPSADANVSGTITCDQPTVQLLGASNTPGVTYQWTGPNGFSAQSQSPFTNAPGVYTLTVQNPVNGCTATDAITVNSNTLAPIPTASVSGILSCFVQMVQLIGSSNTPGVTYSWVGPNNFSSTNAVVGVSTSGIYALTIKNPSNGCTGSTSVNVQDNYALPNVSAMGGTKTCASPTVNLMGQSTTPGATYFWTGPNGYVSTQQNPVVSAVGSYTLKVTHPQSGCTAVATATVSQNTTPPSIWCASTVITCSNPNGKITTNSSPQGLQYQWSGPSNFSSNLQNPTVLVPGYYYVTATNPGNGCTNTTSVFVDANNTPPFAYAGEERSLNCFQTSVLINASFSSSGPNYTYFWTTWDGHIVSGHNTLYPRVDLEGTYTLTVTNTQNGCKDVDSVTVVQRDPVQATVTQQQPVNCSGGADGILKATGSGGSLVYNYQWSNGSLTATNSGLMAGSYTVTVMDSEGCSASQSITLQELVLSAVINVTHQTVPGLNNGTASVTGIGGTSPYTAKWSTGAMTFSIGSLAPGAYTVTLTDAKGCTIIKTANINAANCVMTGSVSATNVTCAGLANGSATVQLSAATNPVVYAWSNGANTKTATGLIAGTYSVTATDATGCKVILQAQVSSPQALTTSIAAQTNLLCPESTNGSLSLGVSGGVQPYQYSWSNGAQGASVSNLQAGLYQATVTDANGCSNSISAQISSPSPLVISVLEKTNVSCPNDHFGAISMGVTGGQTPYQYFWSNGQSTSAIGNLTAGTYWLTVSDQNGCQKLQEIVIIANDQVPPALQLKSASVDLDASGQVSISAGLFDNGSTDNCGIVQWTVTPSQFQCGQTGLQTVTVTATDLGGNTSTGTTTLLVQDNIIPQLICPQNIQAGFCQPQVQYNLPTVADNCAFLPAQLIQVSGLPSGSNFPIGVTTVAFRYADASGNIGQCSFEVNISDPADFQTITQHVNCTDACNGGLSLLQLSGGTVQIQWSNGAVGFNNTNLCPGTYSATITDGFQCTQTIASQVQVQDMQAPQLSCPTNQTVGYCQGPVFYNLPTVIDNCTINPTQVQLSSGLPSGANFPIGTTLQVYQYTDGSGNTGQCSFSVTVSPQPSVQTSLSSPACYGLCNGSASLLLSGGAGPYTVQWSNGQTGTQAIGLCAGSYAYSIQDQAGCTFVGAVNLTQPQPLVVLLEQTHQDPGNLGAGSIQVLANGGTSPFNFNWTRNGQFFANTEDLSNLFAGQYALVVTDAHGCTNSLGPISISNAVGTDELTEQILIDVNPNPAQNEVWIRWTMPASERLQIRLIDQTGRLLQEWRPAAEANTCDMDVSKIPQGIYLIQLTDSNGHTQNRKLLIAR